MSERYTPAAIALHWIVAILILANLALGLFTVDLPLSPRKLQFFSYHKWIGVTVFMLAAARLLWRLAHPAPALPATMRPWERRAAHWTHVLLYVLFFSAPLTGWLFSSAAGIQTVYLGVLPIPDLLPRDKSLADALKLAHKSINFTMAGVIAIHAAAALKHHFIDKDDVLRRMLPRFKHLCVLCALCVAALHAGSAYSQQKIVRERSQIRFVTKQMNVPVEGQFRKFDGTVSFDPLQPSATKAEFTVDLGSIDLNNEEGETEAKRKLWLDVGAFPTAKFVAASVKALGNNRYEATGPLTIKGVSHDVTAQLTVAEANGMRTVEGQFPLKRLQYRIGEGQWSDTDTVADEVLVRFRFTIPVR